ncbi:hypothetical protein VXQ92_11380 [Acinetobacter sp. 228]|uniref:hypothetical protein n=1 Tax=Acinetobacter sp. 228 TaxID=3114700 RepID=UPI003A83EE9E
MKRLPEYNGLNNNIWNYFKVLKKSLQLSPIEKPDMSPFLVHMTGKNQILEILKSGEDDEHGLIKSSVPSQSQSSWYKREVVCFTESVLHSIDSFRYIAFNRFKSNLFYGIGFSKEKLALHERIRPALYIDKNTIGDLASLEANLPESIENFTSENIKVKRLLDNLIPFITPVFQDENRQGYTWEREWRYFNAESMGFKFSYEDIEIICCPPSEKSAIEEQLGSFSRNIKFVSTWGEYNEVVEFMKSRQHNFSSGIYRYSPIERLEQHKQEFSRAKNQLEAYKEYAVTLSNQINDLKEYISDYGSEIQKIDIALNKARIKQKEIDEHQAILDSRCDECIRDFEPQERKTKYKKGLDFDRGFQPYICRECALRLDVNID